MEPESESDEVYPFSDFGSLGGKYYTSNIFLLSSKLLI